MNTATQSQPYPLLFALDVAEGFIEQHARSSDEEEHIRQTAFIVGEHLAAAGHPGDWAVISVPELFQQTSSLTPHGQVGMSITIVGLYVWLGVVGLVSVADCKSVLCEIVATVPNVQDVDCLYSLADSGRRYLDFADAQN